MVEEDYAYKAIIFLYKIFLFNLLSQKSTREKQGALYIIENFLF